MDFYQDILFPAIVSILSAYFTVKLTMKAERKKVVNELKREVYFKSLKNIAEILDNPLVIFEDNFICKLKNNLLEMEIYADKIIYLEYKKMFDAIIDKYSVYNSKVDEELDFDGSDYLFSQKFWKEKLEKAKLEYQLENFPDVEEIEKMASKIKNAISDCLRKG